MSLSDRKDPNKRYDIRIWDCFGMRGYFDSKWNNYNNSERKLFFMHNNVSQLSRNPNETTESYLLRAIKLWQNDRMEESTLIIKI